MGKHLRHTIQEDSIWLAARPRSAGQAAAPIRVTGRAGYEGSQDRSMLVWVPQACRFLPLDVDRRGWTWAAWTR